MPDTIERIKALPVDTVPAGKLIVAGVSIGRTSIAEKASVIGQMLGTPDKGDAAMGKALSIWISKLNPQFSTTIYFTTNFGDKEEASRVSQVRVTSPFFITQNHIAVGSSWEEITRDFPRAKLAGHYSDTVTKSEVRVLDDVPGGIAFEINSGSKCVGITIHKKTEKAFETYINFLEGYTPVSNK